MSVITTKKQIIDQNRRFIDHFNGIRREPIRDQSTTPHPINRFSSYYEIAEGIHRTAIAYQKGQQEIDCTIQKKLSITYLQELILNNHWTPNEPLLYQP